MTLRPFVSPTFLLLESLTRFLLCIGGNSADKADPGSVTSFVKEHGGHTVITKVRTQNETRLKISYA